MSIDKINWTKKDQKFMRCVCCDNIAINRHDGWWIHKKCLEELVRFLRLWRASVFGLKMEVIDWEKAILLTVNYDSDKIQAYNRELEGKAYETFVERYGSPSWRRSDIQGEKVK